MHGRTSGNAERALYEHYASERGETMSPSVRVGSGRRIVVALRARVGNSCADRCVSALARRGV